MGVSLSVVDSAWPFSDVPLCPGVTFDKSVCSSVSMSASVWIVISTKSTCPPVSSDASLDCVSAVCGWVTGCCSLQSKQMHLASESSPGRAHSLCTHLKQYRDDQEMFLDKIRNKPHNQYLQWHYCVCVLTNLWQILQHCRVTDGLAALLQTPHVELRWRWQASHTA